MLNEAEWHADAAPFLCKLTTENKKVYPDFHSVWREKEMDAKWRLIAPLIQDYPEEK